MRSNLSKITFFISISIFLLCNSCRTNSAKSDASQSNLKTRYLILIRHAKSNKDSLSMTLADFDRPLDSSGFLDAHKMNKFLLSQQDFIGFEKIIYSPALRTTQTYIELTKNSSWSSVGVPNSDLYRSTIENYLAVVKKSTHSISSLGHIGHNPTITELANRLQSDKFFDEVPTGAVLLIKFQLKSWQEIETAKGKLILFKSPKGI